MGNTTITLNNGNSTAMVSALSHQNQGRCNYILHLADTNLVLAQRNAEWCGHGPILEQDIAITNISLDLLGQARNFYQHAAVCLNEDATNTQGSANSIGAKEVNEATEDSLAYLRTEREFKNLLITELPRGDWAQTILRQFFYSVYQYLLYESLQICKDAQLAAIAEKSIKETTYHLQWSSEWVIRLGDGTAESRERLLKAMDQIWAYTGEFFVMAEYEKESYIGFDIASLKQPWLKKVSAILLEATIWNPSYETGAFMHTGGKNGIHTEHLGFILAEMQYLQRTYPGAQW